MASLEERLQLECKSFCLVTRESIQERGIVNVSTTGYAYTRSFNDEVTTIIKPWGPAIQKKQFPKFTHPWTVILKFREDWPASYHEIRKGIFRVAANSLVFLALALATDLTNHRSLLALTSSPSLNCLLMNSGQKLCNDGCKLRSLLPCKVTPWLVPEGDKYLPTSL